MTESAPDLSKIQKPLHLPLVRGGRAQGIYLRRYDSPGPIELRALDIIQFERYASIPPNQALLYHYKINLDRNCQRLCQAIKNETPHFDVVLAPYSTRTWLDPYLMAAEQLFGASENPRPFNKKKGLKAGDTDVTLEDLIEDLIYTPSGCEANYKSILFIDDSIGSGKTTAAMAEVMMHAGVAEDSKFYTAAPLLVASHALTGIPRRMPELE